MTVLNQVLLPIRNYVYLLEITSCGMRQAVRQESTCDIQLKMRFYVGKLQLNDKFQKQNWHPGYPTRNLILNFPASEEEGCSLPKEVSRTSGTRNLSQIP